MLKTLRLNLILGLILNLFIGFKVPVRTTRWHKAVGTYQPHAYPYSIIFVLWKNVGHSSLKKGVGKSLRALISLLVLMTVKLHFNPHYLVTA